MNDKDATSLRLAPFQFSELQISGFVTQRSLDVFPFLIGRRSECNLVLDHPQVSGFHAKITRNNGKIVLEDLKSSNGTYVSNTLIDRETLQPGDAILILPFFLIFSGAHL